jgi:hypothetical protein
MGDSVRYNNEQFTVKKIIPDASGLLYFHFMEGFMNKIVLVLLSAALFFSGCFTGNRMSRIYDKTYDYDKLYSSTLLA